MLAVQRKTRIIPFTFTGAASPTIQEGTGHFTVSRTGAGDHSLTLTKPGLRACVLLGATVNAAGDNTVNLGAAISASVIRLQSRTAGTLTDLQITGAIMVFDTADVNATP